jgi:hypothetical protein
MDKIAVTLYKRAPPTSVDELGIIRRKFPLTSASGLDCGPVGSRTTGYPFNQSSFWSCRGGSTARF